MDRVRVSRYLVIASGSMACSAMSFRDARPVVGKRTPAFGELCPTCDIRWRKLGSIVSIPRKSFRHNA